jgi:hypothetical protein
MEHAFSEQGRLEVLLESCVTRRDGKQGRGGGGEKENLTMVTNYIFIG